MADFRSRHEAAWLPRQLTFWPSNWCRISAMARTTFLPILAFQQLFFVELWANMTWRYNLDLWSLKTLHMSVMRVIILHQYAKFDAFSFSRQQFQSGLKTHLFKRDYVWFYLRELLRSELTYLLYLLWFEFQRMKSAFMVDFRSRCYAAWWLDFWQLTISL